MYDLATLESIAPLQSGVRTECTLPVFDSVNPEVLFAAKRSSKVGLALPAFNFFCPGLLSLPRNMA